MTRMTCNEAVQLALGEMSRNTEQFPRDVVFVAALQLATIIAASNGMTAEDFAASAASFYDVGFKRTAFLRAEGPSEITWHEPNDLVEVDDGAPPPAVAQA